MRPRSWSYRRYGVGIIAVLLATAAACSSGGDDNGTATATPTPLTGQRAPTALATIPPTPAGTASPGVATPEPTVTPRPGSTVTPRPTATSTSTPGRVLPDTPTPLPGATSTPTPRPTSTPPPPVVESGRELVNEPLGVLQLRPGIGSAVQYAPGVNSPDFRVNVGFVNPFHPDFSPWDYGVKFRDDGQRFQMFVFDHEGNLNLISGNRNDLTIEKTVDVPGMVTSGGGRNSFTILVVGDRASVLINQDLIDVFTIDDTLPGTELSVVSDVFNQTIVVGALTEFFDLVINSAGLIGFTESGQLVRELQNQIPIGDFSFPSSAGYMTVTFVSPVNAFSGDYSFGLLFRARDGSAENWLVLEDTKTWRHVRRTADGTESILGTGEADPLKTAIGDENALEFFSTGQRNNIYLNGELIMTLALPAEDLPANVAPMAAFEPGHQAGMLPTEYYDFAVWSVES